MSGEWTGYGSDWELRGEEAVYFAKPKQNPGVRMSTAQVLIPWDGRGAIGGACSRGGRDLCLCGVQYALTGQMARFRPVRGSVVSEERC